MRTVDDFAQGMLRDYNTFARQCVALVAEVGDEERAADCFAMEDLPGVAERLGALRARAEAAEQRAEAAEADAGATRAAAARERDRMRGNVDAWQARAEAAEQRAEALAAAQAQARADARVLAGLAYGLEECGWVEEGLVPAGLTGAEADALDDAYDAVGLLSDAEVLAVIRRALGGAA